MQNPANSVGPVAEDPHGRQPFAHPALEGLNSLSDSTKVLLTGKTKLAQLAQKYDMQNVLRWSPRKVCSLSFYFSRWSLLTNGCTAQQPRCLRNRTRHGSHNVRGYRRHCSGKGWTFCQQGGSGSDIGTLGREDDCLSGFRFLWEDITGNWPQEHIMALFRYLFLGMI